MLGTVFFSSCLKDEYEFDELSVTLSPEIAAPLITATIQARDILSLVDSNMLRENSDNLFEFIFNDTIYSIGLDKFIDIPDTVVNYDFNLSPIVIDDITPKLTSIRLDTVAKRMGGAFYITIQDAEGDSAKFPEFPIQNAGNTALSLTGAPFSSAKFSEGILKLELTNGWPTEITAIEIAFNRVSDGVAIDTLKYASIMPGETLSDSVFLEGKTIESEMQAEFISLAIPRTDNKVAIRGSDSLGIVISGYNMVIVGGTAILLDQEVLNDTILVDFDLGLGEELETLVLKTGDLDFGLTYQINEAAKLYVELPYATKDGEVFSDSISVAAGPIVVSKSFDLSGYTIDLTKGGQVYNSIETRVKAQVVSSGLIVPFDTSNTVKANVSMKNIKPLYIDGYFGSQTLTMDLDTNDFDIGDVDILKKMNFADPEVTLSFCNTFGLPIEISRLDLIMQKNLDQEVLTGVDIPFTIAGGDINAPGTAVTSYLVIDGASTNIEDGINLWPNKVIAGFTGDVNPSRKEMNYATDTSELKVTFGLNVPFYFTLSDYEIRDTVELDSSIFEHVLSATIRSNVENEFPLEGKVGIYVVDENFVVLDSLTNGLEILIEAATVDANGETVNVAKKQTDLVASEDAVFNLRNAARLIIVTRLGSGNNGNAVKIYSNYSMNIKLGLLAKINYELNKGDNNEE